MDHIFITGISGFLGHNLVLALSKKENTLIHGLVLPNETNLSFFDAYPNVNLTRGNICDPEDVHRFLSQKSEGRNIIIHAAGRITTFKNNDPLTMAINVGGTKNMVDVATKLGGFDAFIYVSSVDAVSKRNDDAIIYEPEIYDPDTVEGVYSKSKAQANNIVLSVKDKMRCIIVLPSAIMGPHDPFSAPINNAIRRYINGKLPAIVKGGYDIVDVRDVAQGILACIDHGETGSSYFLSGTAISVKYLIGLASEVENRQPVTRTIPHGLVKVASPFIELDARLRHKTPLFTGFSMDCLKQNPTYSHAKAQHELGYQPRDIHLTMEETIAWMHISGYLKR